MAGKTPVEAALEKLPDTERYAKADVAGHEGDVAARVGEFIDAVQGTTDAEKKKNLPVIRRLIHEAVDYVQADLPAGVERVDGYVVQPILEAAVDERIAALPVEAPELP